MGILRKDGKPAVTIRRIVDLMKEGKTAKQTADQLGITEADVEQRLMSKSGQVAVDRAVTALKVHGRMQMARKLGTVAEKLAEMVESDQGEDKKTTLIVLGRLLAAERRLERSEGKVLPERVRVRKVKELPAGVMDERALAELGAEAEKELEENAEE